MRILVTGGAGFIGSHIVDFHLTRGDEVKVIDDLSTGSTKNIDQFKDKNNFEFTQGSLLTCPVLEKYATWAERIYHMAAVIGVYRVIAEPINVLNTNITATEHLFKLIANSQAKPRIIIASSSSVYGHSPKPLLNEKDSLIVSPHVQPLWGYAVSKIADEALASAYHQMHQLNITPVRFFNTVGPRQTGLYGMVVPRFVQQACRGEPLTIFGDGTQTRSFCDVRDSIVALDIIAEKNLSIAEPINVGNDSEITINELANIVRKCANSSSSVNYVPYKEAYGKDFHDIKQRRPDISKLRELTGFKHKWTLEETVKDLIQRFRAT
ncbi:MAG: GDP-mannose 4,6-dehydratase [Gammaproteobacteria bacterium]|nr:GDP-mannose 4,6-dehydratase [Gammaproteobacteria bacterium]